MGLAEKYRPRTFEAVVGQDAAVARCISLLKGQPGSIVLAGPTGTGKTSLAAVFAAALLCDARGPSPSPCAKCESCRAIQKGAGTMSYEEHNCARLDAAGIENIVERTRSHPIGSNHRVVLLDEAHQLTPKSAEKLLTVMERRPWNIFLFATTKVAKLPQALRNRCSEIELALVDAATATTYLAQVCEWETISAEHKALELIAYQAEGHLRPLLQYLEDCTENGAVMAADVRRLFRLDFCDDLAAILKASLAGDIDEAQQFLDRLHGDPAHRRNLVHGALVEIYWRDKLRLRQATSVFSGINAEDRAAIKEGIDKSALAARLPAATLWEAAIAIWAPGAPATAATLKMDTVRFGTLLTLSPPASSTTKDLSEPKTRRRRRRAVRGGAEREAVGERAIGWSGAEIQKIWDAGSALLQLHGVTFNGLCVLRRSGLAMAETEFAAHGSNLVHEAGQQLRRLDGGRLHYLMRHNRTARDGFMTAILFHVPGGCDELLRDWIEGFVERRFGSAAARRIMHLRITQPATAEEGLRRHWRLVRLLSGPLDPAVEVRHEGRRQRLVDVLRVPSRLRVPALPLAVGHRLRVSESIGASVRMKARDDGIGLLSPFADHAWDVLTNGWELSEFRERIREHDERARARAMIDAQWPVSGDDRLAQIRTAKLMELANSWPLDPRQRLRSWRGWWLPGAGAPTKLP